MQKSRPSFLVAFVVVVAAVIASASACASIMGVEEATLNDPNVGTGDASGGGDGQSVGTGDGPGGDPGDGGCIGAGCVASDGGNDGGGGKDASVIDAAPDSASALALSFDGVDDVVRVARQVQDDFTLEAWIKTTTSRAGVLHYEGLGVLYADVFGDANDFGTSILNGKFAFGVTSTTIQSTSIVTTGQWTHVAAVRVRSSGTMRILINGVQETTTGSASNASLNANPYLDIGGNLVDGRYYAGLIDEVRIWNVARTAGQILGAMKTKLVGNETGLVGYWRFDDGTSITTDDSSPSNNDGNLGNGNAPARPTWVPSGAF